MASICQKTFCRICEAQCGLEVTTDGDAVVGIKPNRDHVASRGYACIKGLKMGEFARSPDRLRTPLKKVNGEFEPISWDQAITEIGSRLRAIHDEHGGDSIAAYMGNPIGFSLWPTSCMMFMLEAFDAHKLFTPGTQDCANKFSGGERLFGGPNEQVFPDIEHTQLLIAIGSNPAISKMSFISVPHPMEKIEAIESRGGKVYWVNPRYTESAKRMGEFVAIRPDTDVFFMLGFLNEVIRCDGVDKQRVEKYMNGYDELVRISAPWTAERVAGVTKIPADTLRQMVSDYLAADGAALYFSTGVNQGRFGLMVYWLQEAINAITGNLDKRGGVLAGKGVLPKYDAPDELRKSRINDIPYSGAMVPGGIMAEEILTPGKGQVKAMFNMSGNPLLTCSGSNQLARAFESLDLFVCLDIFRNETAEYADYILPTLHSLERADIPFQFFTMMGLMPTRSFSYTDPVLRPFAQAREEGLIFRQICRAAGKPIAKSRLFQWFSNIAESFSKVPAVGDWLSLEKIFLSLMIRSAKLGGIRKMRKHPDGVLLEPNEPGDYLGQRVNTPSGKVELAPPDLIERVKTLDDEYNKELENANELKIIQKRERFSHNTWTHNVDAFIKGGGDTNYLYINSVDARSRGLEDGMRARISANNQSIEVPVKIDDDMMVGTVSVPHGWGHQRAKGLNIANKTAGANVNVILPSGPDSIEPASGMSHMNGVIVSVTTA